MLTNLRTNWFPCSLSQNTIGGYISQWLWWEIPTYSSRRLNIRPGGGGNAILTTPAGFLQIEKNGGAAPQFLACLFIHPFCTIPENFSTRSSQVRSRDHISKIFMTALWLQFLTDPYETFWNWLKHQYLQNVYLRIFLSVTWGQINFVTGRLWGYDYGAMKPPKIEIAFRNSAYV